MRFVPEACWCFLHAWLIICWSVCNLSDFLVNKLSMCTHWVCGVWISNNKDFMNYFECFTVCSISKARGSYGPIVWHFQLRKQYLAVWCGSRIVPFDEKCKSRRLSCQVLWSKSRCKNYKREKWRFSKLYLSSTLFNVSTLINNLWIFTSSKHPWSKSYMLFLVS